MIEFLKTYASLLIYPVLALFLSTGLTWICMKLLPKLGYIDHPGGRHIHDRLVPRGGGIAVIFAFFIALGLFSISGHVPESGVIFWRLFVPALPLGVLGMIDDRFELKPWLKLCVQFLVVLLVWMGNAHNYTVLGWQIPWFISLGATAVWIIVIINAFNLIDGLDGLASGLAVISSGCMAIWFLMSSGHRAETVTMLILAASCLGFLCYNFHPAKIFLGDTGSTFLGLIFAIIGLSTVDRAVTMTSLLLPILAIGVPIFDVILAIWRRSVRKLITPGASGIMEGDNDHLHHRLLRQTGEQTKTAWGMYLLACAFSGITLLFVFFRNSAPAIVYLILLIAVLIAIRRLAIVELFDSALVIQAGLRKPRRGVLLNLGHPLFDFSAIVLSLIITSYLVFGEILNFNLLLVAFISVAIALLLGNTYHVYWLRAGLNNYYHLALCIIWGSVAANLLIYLIFAYPQLRNSCLLSVRSYVLAGTLFTLLNLFFIISERFLLHYAINFWIRKLYCQNQSPEQLQRVVVYGGGLKCRIYVNYLYCIKGTENTREEIIGIIDDDNILKNWHVYGFKVLGQAKDLEKIYHEHPFDKVMLTAIPTTPEAKNNLLRFCRLIKLC